MKEPQLLPPRKAGNRRALLQALVTIAIRVTAEQKGAA